LTCSSWDERRSNLLALAGLSGFGGLLATVRGYTYGSGNYVEQLPLILHAAHPGWLSNDFFTVVASAPGPRMWYSLSLAWVSKLIPLEWAFLALVLLSNMGTILLASLLARDLFGDTAGLVTSFLVSFGVPTRLGGAAFLTASILTPQLLVMPLIVAAVWAATRRKVILCAVLCVLASVFHPLIGLETGAILVLSVGMEHLWQVRRDGHRVNTPLFWRWWVCGVVIMVISAWFWSVVAYANDDVDPCQFVDIVAFFRHPHHYVPSSFPLREYANLFFLLTVVVLSLYWMSLRVSLSEDVFLLLLIVGLVILLCAGGFLFVEVFPSRLWVTAQAFRLIFLVNLIGQMLVAAGLSLCLSSEESQGRLEAFTLVLSAYAPVLMVSVFMLKLLKPLVVRLIKLPSGVYSGLMFATILAYCTARPANGPVFVLLYTLFLIAYSVPLILKKPLGAFLLSGGYVACVGLVLLGCFWPTNPLQRVTRKIISTTPVWSLADTTGPIADIAKYVRDRTPPDSVFLTPPDWGQFRLLADRAIVVDFKAFPFQGSAMIEWRKRLVDCYGTPSAAGFAAISEMQANYRHITDDRLLQLRRKYGVTHAVLYSDTATSFPVLFAADGFQVVAVSERSAPH